MQSRTISPWLLWRISQGAVLLSLVPVSEVWAEEPPKLIQEMITKALALDDPKTVKSIVLIAKKNGS
ncbi:hypothetical protein [Zymomonas mobilis]|uniref:hypothetical protein n=1 Tax=Zymomonas mobilis TaxID=542 RepID=UPI0021AB1946|nr:hypothetical protein [Zymomonas mobilis]